MPYVAKKEWDEIQEKLKNAGSPQPSFEFPDTNILTHKMSLGELETENYAEGLFTHLLGMYENYKRVTMFGDPIGEALDSVYLDVCRILTGGDNPAVYRMYIKGNWDDAPNKDFTPDDIFEFAKNAASFILSRNRVRGLDAGEYDDADGAWKELRGYIDAVCLEYTGRRFQDACEMLGLWEG